MSMLNYYFDLALRSFRAAKGLSLLMILALGLGIGACMTTLTVFHVLGGDPIPGKTLAVDSAGVAWEYVGGVDQTDGDGQLTILLTRTFVDETADRTPVDVVVSVRKGIVSESTTVTF